MQILSYQFQPLLILEKAPLTSRRVLPADLCTGHAHYVKIHRSTVLGRNKNMAVQGGTVSHYYILVIRKFIDFMSLFRHSVWFSFSVKQFPSAEFRICNIQLRIHRKYLKNTHKNPKFRKVRQVPTREFPTKFPGSDLSHSSKFGIFVGIL